MQLRVCHTKKRGVRWTAAEKSLALSFLHVSPKAYRLLSSIIVMPCERTLRNAVKNLQITPGRN